MNTETTLRTLGLPQEYAITDGQITDFKIGRNIVVTKNVDTSKSLKQVSATGKVTWVNAPTTFEFDIVESVDELNNSGTYLPNMAEFFAHATKDNYFAEGNNLTILKNHKKLENSWFGYTKAEFSENSDGLIQIESIGELGANNNLISKVFVKRVNGIDEYKNPVDYLGREIVGKDNFTGEEVVAKTMKISPDKALVTVTMITKTTAGSGSWSTSNPVWSGGVKVYENKSSTYILRDELCELLGKTQEQIEHDVRTTIVCAKLNPATHITSTSTEVIVTGNTYKGITYYSGEDASVIKPTGKITSYNKQYPGHVQRWILKQWEQDGTPIESSPYSGNIWRKQYSSTADTSITVIASNYTKYDAATNTLYYDESKLNELWYEFEELPAQGKNWGGQTIIKLGEIKPDEDTVSGPDNFVEIENLSDSIVEKIIIECNGDKEVINKIISKLSSL